MLYVLFSGAGPLNGYKSKWQRMTVLKNKGSGPQLPSLARRFDRSQRRKSDWLGLFYWQSIFQGAGPAYTRGCAS